VRYPLLEDQAVESLSGLSLDALRRMQVTLTKKGRQRDAENIRAVGFAPSKSAASSTGAAPTIPVTAQFDVHRKLTQLSPDQRIAPVESVRLLDRAARHYQRLNLQTDVVSTGDAVPTGVRVSAGTAFATVSVVVRWTKNVPVPPSPTEDEPQDPRWRWGVLSVAHLFAERQQLSSAVQIERRQTCGSGPPAIEGRVLARGRVPGGPDLSLIETGLDRLWLSGFVSRINAPSIQPAQESHLLHWISQGTTGSFLGDGVIYGWTWRTYYPELTIEKLGSLQQVVRYEIDPQHVAPTPLGPGSSGAVLLAGGIPIGLHIAAERPDYRVGFAQTFAVSLSWLSQQIRASQLAIVGILGDA
jgi:hypothetical protein